MSDVGVWFSGVSRTAGSFWGLDVQRRDRGVRRGRTV